MEINWLDIVLGIPLLYGLVRGLFKGIVQSIGSLIGLVIGIVVAHAYAPTLSQYLDQWFNLTLNQCFTLSYILLFIAVVLLCAMVVKIIDKFLSIITLGWVNKLLGGCFGFLKYALLLSVLVNLLDTVDERLNFIPKEKKEISFLYQPVKSVVPMLMPYVHFYLDSQNETTE